MLVTAQLKETVTTNDFYACLLVKNYDANKNKIKTKLQSIRSTRLTVLILLIICMEIGGRGL